MRPRSALFLCGALSLGLLAPSFSNAHGECQKGKTAQPGQPGGGGGGPQGFKQQGPGPGCNGGPKGLPQGTTPTTMRGQFPTPSSGGGGGFAMTSPAPSFRGTNPYTPMMRPQTPAVQIPMVRQVPMPTQVPYQASVPLINALQTAWRQQVQMQNEQRLAYKQLRESYLQQQTAMQQQARMEDQQRLAARKAIQQQADAAVEQAMNSRDLTVRDDADDEQVRRSLGLDQMFRALRTE